MGVNDDFRCFAWFKRDVDEFVMPFTTCNDGFNHLLMIVETI